MIIYWSALNVMLTQIYVSVLLMAERYYVSLMKITVPRLNQLRGLLPRTPQQKDAQKSSRFLICKLDALIFTFGGYVTVKEVTGSQLRQSSDDSDAAAAAIAQRNRHYPANIKKILLTRKYHDTNVYNGFLFGLLKKQQNIGIRVTGGKKLPSGELAAFVSTINRGKARETLGEIKEGDRVLEWNGVLLTGKTFEEVERVIAASRGEIEVVIASNPSSGTQVTLKDVERTKSAEKQKSKRERRHDGTHSHSQKSEAPPVPAHRCANGQTSLSSDSYLVLKPPKLSSKTVSLQPRNHVTGMQQPDTVGYLNVALAYNMSTSTLMVTVLSAKSLTFRQYCNATFYPNPFVKVYLLPGRRVSSKRRTKFVPNTSDPVWDQTLEYTIPFRELYSHYLEFTVWDYDKFNDNNALGQLLINLSDPYVLDGTARWYPLHPTENDFAVLNLSSPNFQGTTGTVNGYAMPHYNPGISFIYYNIKNSKFTSDCNSTLLVIPVVFILLSCLEKKFTARVCTFGLKCGFRDTSFALLFPLRDALVCGQDKSDRMDMRCTWEKIHVLDGGFGTELEIAGCEIENNPLWSCAALFDRPDLILQVHKRFIEAGSDIILTNTYHASISTMMSSFGMTKTAAESSLKKLVSLAKQAVKECSVQEKVKIFGSVGPYGVILHDGSEYNGHYVDEIEEQVMVDYYMQQTIPLLQAGLSVIAYETVPSCKEAMAILKAVDAIDYSYNFWISFSCKNGEQTNHNESFHKSVEKISHHPNILGVGINCTSPSYITPLLQSASTSVNSLPFIVYPNSGEIYEHSGWRNGECVFPDMEQLMKWKYLGAKVMGGCCRVTAEKIQELSMLVAKLNA
uniref:C2 domain-containing protein n=1 Tax=Setaria digitata TaxID=48799 RepID=A0A915PES4_9BILA